MDSEGLPHKIEALVDYLRDNRGEHLTLADVASVTEVLIGAMRTFFRQVDTQIYRECRAMSEYITNARSEIATLQPQQKSDNGIPRAGLELDAIVSQTEEATNTIMESAEAIMSADPSDPDAYQAVVQDSVMAIFEACSFQDITGQRISKVVETLSYVEGRVLQLRDLLGVTDTDVDTAQRQENEQRDEEKALLNGPALDGEGIAQTDVDQLLGGEADADAIRAKEKAPTPKADTAETPSAPKPSTTDDGDDKSNDGGNGDNGGKTSQSDIDALFG